MPNMRSSTEFPNPLHGCHGMKITRPWEGGSDSAPWPSAGRILVCNLYPCTRTWQYLVSNSGMTSCQIMCHVKSSKARPCEETLTLYSTSLVGEHRGVLCENRGHPASKASFIQFHLTCWNELLHELFCRFEDHTVEGSLQLELCVSLGTNDGLQAFGVTTGGEIESPGRIDTQSLQNRRGPS